MGSNKIESLKAMGFKPNSIVEVILTTRNSDGTINAAPMGIKVIEDGLIEIKPFKTSKTYSNLKRRSEVCLNISQDPWLYLITAFKNDLETLTKINENLMIAEAQACIFCKVIVFDDYSDQRGLFKVKPTQIQVISQTPLVFSRGVGQAIEAVIHATRVKAYTEQGMFLEADHLKERIMECVEVIKRVSSQDTSEYRVAEKTIDLIEKWGTKE